MVMSRDQNAGRRQNVKTDNRCSSFERVEHFKCLGTNLTNQNSIEEAIKSRSKSGMLAIILTYLLTYLLHGAESFLRS